MAHRRALVPVRAPSADDLTADLVGIGILVGGEGSRDPNIEDTLVFASVEGMDHGDLRVLSALVTWFGVHLGRVNADRLTRLVALQESRRVRAFWAALAHWRAADRRFARLGRGHRGPRVELLPVGTDFQVERHGEDARFAGTSLRLPANVLRDRPADVLSPVELAKTHRPYNWRLVIGATYRADMWAALEQEQNLSPSALARATYGSFATAWQVKRDFEAWRRRPHSRMVRAPSSS